MSSVNKWISLSVTFGVTTTALFYSGYGVNDHLEQLPIIFRSLNDGYLLNDFFTNASSNSIARIWYAQVLAKLAGSEQNLPALFLILTLSSNIAISITTYNLAENLFKSHLAGICASALVMSVSTFSLGSLSSLYQTYLVPVTIATPLVFCAIDCFLQGKLAAGLLLSGFASIFHPLFGLETGGLLFVAYFSYCFLAKQKPKYIIVILGLFIFLPLFFSVLPQVSQSSLDPNQFIYIVAHFRHPHHYVPSTFEPSEYAAATVFLMASALLYYKWFVESHHPFGLIPATIGVLVLALCAGGFIFVEVIPSRFFTTAQTFRLLYIVKWLGVIFIAGAMASMKALIDWLENKHFTKLDLTVSFIFTLSVGFYVYAGLTVTALSIACLGTYVFLVKAFSGSSNRLWLALPACVIVSIGILAYYPQRSLANQFKPVNLLRANLALAIKPELPADGVRVARFASTYTPEESAFLTPPGFGQFRLLAKRAIVVDFKSFPFSDAGIGEWYRRIITCYGIPISRGFGMLNELEDSYRAVDDNTLLSLQKEYNFSYAVLYNETPTSFEVIYENDTYKVIHLLDHE